MADFEFADRADFQKMVDSQIEETLTLEYKASPALTRESKNIDELCKDVSSMANSAGGQIIYGIEEDKKTHKPSAVDDGITDEKITREWIVQILNSRIQPRIDGVRVQRIPLGDTGAGFVLTVPATISGPHQAPDKKYYKRLELHSVPMEDYEIRDVISRSTSPHLEPVLTFDGRESSSLNFKSGAQVSDPINFNVTLRNTSVTPAHYTAIVIGLDISLLPTIHPPLISLGKFDDGFGNTLNWFQRRIGIPTDFPIFKELPFEAVPHQSYFVVPEHALQETEFLIRVRVFSPGYFCERAWSVGNGGARLLIRPMP
jgi:Putative DNA-binding domain